jgi:hypothetical protein
VVLADVEIHILTGVQPNLHISFHIDLLDGSELAVKSHTQTKKKGIKMMIDPATYQRRLDKMSAEAPAITRSNWGPSASFGQWRGTHYARDNAPLFKKNRTLPTGTRISLKGFEYQADSILWGNSREGPEKPRWLTPGE